MDKKYWIYPMIVSVAVGLGVPWVSVAFLTDMGMIVYLTHFYALEPMVSAWIGWRAAEYPRTLWCLPVASALFFLLGVWLQFEMGEPVFTLYSGIYIAIGYVTMLARMLFRKILG